MVSNGKTRFMSKEDYKCVIERGHSEINDKIIDFLKTKIIGRYIDIGCNTGWLLSEVRGGVGVDSSRFCIDKAREKGLIVHLANAEELPFRNQEFDMAILSCIMEQSDRPMKILNEAKRVARKVIGINPIPGSRWGVIGGHVKSVIPPELMEDIGCETFKFDNERYYFTI